jgi:hypothetical protein
VKSGADRLTLVTTAEYRYPRSVFVSQRIDTLTGMSTADHIGLLDRPTSRGTAEDPREVGDRRLPDGIIEHTHQINRLLAERAAWVAELDARRAYGLDAARSAASWLRHHCHMTASQATALVKVARGLKHMIVSAKQFAAGELDQHRMQRLAAACRDHPDVFARDEQVLVDHALTLSAKDFARSLGYWRQTADDQAENRAALLHERRGLRFSPSYSGSVAGDFLLDAEDGAVVMTALSVRVSPWLKDKSDSRTPAQARVDAFVEICRDYLDHGDVPVVGGERPHALVVVDLKTLGAGNGTLCEVDGAGVITPETARRMLRDASLSRVITKGRGQVLDVGRATRTVSPAHRQALIVRDRGCAAVGCDVPHQWTDAHPRKHWIDGGESDLINLILLRRFHHRMIHLGIQVELRAPPLRE